MVNDRRGESEVASGSGVVSSADGALEGNPSSNGTETQDAAAPTRG